MLKQIVKRSLKILCPITIVIIGLFHYAKTDNFKNNLKYILNEVVNINVDFSDILIKPNYIKIMDLNLKTQDGIEVIKAKDAMVYINLLQPLRLSKVILNDGFVLFERENGKINLSRILKQTDGEIVYKKHSFLGKLEFKNFEGIYIEKSYKNKIEKKFTNVNGYLINNLYKIIELEMEANSVGKYTKEDENLKLRIDFYNKYQENNFYDIISKNSFEKNNQSYLGLKFNFNNLDVDNNLMQYAPIDRFLSVYKAKLNGDFSFNYNEEDKIEFYGNLKLKNANGRYFDFEKDINNANVDINFNKYDINLKADSKIDDADFNFKLDFFMDKEYLDIGLNFKNLSYDNLAKYKLIKMLGLKGNSKLIFGDLNVGISLLNNKMEIDKFNGNLKTNHFETLGVELENLDLKMYLKDKNILGFKSENIEFDKKIFEESLNGLASFDGNFNINKNIFEAKYNLVNKSKILDIEKFEGDILIDKNKNINIKTNSDKLNLDTFVNLKENKVIVNSNFKEHFNSIYKNDKYRLDYLEIKNLIYGIKEKKILSLDGKIDIKSLENEFFDTLNINFNKKNSLYNLNGNIVSKLSNFSFNGYSDENMEINKYNINMRDINTKDINEKLNINTYGINFDNSNLNTQLNIINNNKNIVISGNFLEDTLVKYKEEEFKMLPKISNLVYDKKTKSIIDGEVNLSLKKEDKFFDRADINIKVSENQYDISANVEKENSIINVYGQTSKDLKHSYKVSGKNIELFKNLENLKILNNDSIKDNKLHFNFEANLNGENKKIYGDLKAFSEYFDSNISYENLSIDAKINDLLNYNMDVDLKMDEFWLKYQRFLDVSANININKDRVSINKFSNDKLDLKMLYAINDKILNLSTKLKNYTIYSTFNPDLNLLINELNLNVKGKLDNLEGSLEISPSSLILSENKIGDFTLKADIENSILNIDELKLRNYNILGKYNLKNNEFDFELDLKENNINELINIDDLNLNISSKLNIVGNINDAKISSKFEIEDLSYKDYSIPKVYIDLEHNNANLKNLTRSGILDINNFEIRDSNNKELIKLKEKINLKNLVYNNKVSKTIVLEEIEFLNSKNYKGNVKIDGILRLDNEDIFASLKLNGENITLNSFNVNNFFVDIQGNSEGLNLSELYLEYENNPFLIDGYVSYLLNDYNFRLMANDFNLKFLEISENVEKSDGKANLNLYFKKKLLEGNANLENIVFKTKSKNVDIKDLNSNIDINNKSIRINELKGNINGGSIDVAGNLEFPEISDDFLKSKKIKLGPIDLNLLVDGVSFNYGEDISAKLTTDIKIENNKVNGKAIINESEIRGTSILNNEKKEDTNKINQYLTELSSQILKNILSQYIVDVDIETEKNIKLNIPTALGVIKEIKGEIYGNSKINVINSNTNIEAELELENSKFILNGHEFTVVEAYIRNSGTLNPKINFKAISYIQDDEIEISIVGNLNEREITLKSLNGKNTNEILGILAFDEVGGILSLERLKATNLVGKALETTLNNLLFSTITNKISNTLGINDLKIKANFDSSNTKALLDIINNTTTTFYINNNFFGLDNLYWNAELTVPFDLTSAVSIEKLKYNIWLNHHLRKGISSTLGMKNLFDNNKNKLNYYLGIQYDSRYRDFEDLFEDLGTLFKDKENLK